MKAVTRSIHVGRPPDEVFAWVGDLSRYRDFFVGVSLWEPIGEVRNRVGERFKILLEIGATHTGGRVVITERSAPRHLAWESEVGTRHRARFELTPRDGGTDVALTLEFRLTGRIFGRLVEQIATPIVERILVATLETLRDRVEWQHVDAV